MKKIFFKIFCSLLIVYSLFTIGAFLKDTKAYFLLDVVCDWDGPATFCETSCASWGAENTETLSWCNSFTGRCAYYSDDNPPACFCTCTDPVHPIICVTDDDCRDGEGACSNGDCTYPENYVCIDRDDCRQSNGGPCSDDLPDEKVVCGYASEDDPTGICDCNAVIIGSTPIFPTTPPQAVFCVGDDPDIRTNTPSDPENAKIATAIGCIPVGGEQPFTEFILKWGAGIAGGIALILIVVAGIMFITSGGDPKRMQAAKELLTAAIAGLLFLIFGVFILEFIGVDILGIPGFGS